MRRNIWCAHNDCLSVYRKMCSEQVFSHLLYSNILTLSCFIKSINPQVGTVPNHELLVYISSKTAFPIVVSFLLYVVAFQKLNSILLWIHFWNPFMCIHIIFHWKENILINRYLNKRYIRRAASKHEFSLLLLLQLKELKWTGNMETNMRKYMSYHNHALTLQFKLSCASKMLLT